MIDVVCVADPAGGAWSCAVHVQEGASATDHVVVVDEIDLPPALDGADVPDIERLVAVTFEFLLEREPKESILRRFALPVVAGYFPEYPESIAERLVIGAGG